MRLKGKVAIVSGGSSGIGAVACRLFAGEKAAGIIVADINAEGGLAVASAINEAGGQATFIHLDVSDESAWRDAVSTTVSTYGRLDITVNNAGLSLPEGRARIEETSLAVWDEMHAVNLTGVFLGMKHSIAPMRESGGGSLINISSIYGLIGSIGSTAYHSAKGAVRNLTKAAAIQYAPEGIRANSIHPGFTDTGMTAKLHAQPGERAARIGKTPIGRMGTPEDIAWGCVYLASDESSFVTGAELVIDGGMVAQ